MRLSFLDPLTLEVGPINSLPSVCSLVGSVGPIQISLVFLAKLLVHEQGCAKKTSYKQAKKFIPISSSIFLGYPPNLCASLLVSQSYEGVTVGNITVVVYY